MSIFNFEAEDRIEEIKSNYQKVTEIRESLAENREKYRMLSDDIGISKYSIFTCCDTYECVWQ